MNRRRAAGAAWLAAPTLYLGAEWIAAGRFSPRYSYARDFISDLGAPGCHLARGGVTWCSPLHAVMNVGFIGAGLLFVVAVALIFPLLVSRTRYAFATAGAAHGVGLAMVGVFHGAGAGRVDGLSAYHVTGAALAIGGGNLAIFLCPAPGDLGAPAAIRGLSRLGPIVGIAAAVILILAKSRHAALPPGDGGWERLSVYTIVAWEAVIGVWLLARAGAERAGLPRSERRSGGASPPRAARFPRQDGGHGLGETGRDDGLGHHVGHAAGEIDRDLAGRGRRAHGDDRDVAERRGQGADRARRRHAVHPRHEDVHQDDGEAAGSHRVQRLVAVRRRLVRQAEPIAIETEQQAVLRQVIDNQHPAATQRRLQVQIQSAVRRLRC